MEPKSVAEFHKSEILRILKSTVVIQTPQWWQPLQWGIDRMEKSGTARLFPRKAATTVLSIVVADRQAQPSDTPRWYIACLLESLASLRSLSLKYPSAVSPGDYRFAKEVVAEHFRGIGASGENVVGDRFANVRLSGEPEALPEPAEPLSKRWPIFWLILVVTFFVFVALNGGFFEALGSTSVVVLVGWLIIRGAKSGRSLAVRYAVVLVLLSMTVFGQAFDRIDKGRIALAQACADGNLMSLMLRADRKTKYCGCVASEVASPAFWLFSRMNLTPGSPSRLTDAPEYKRLLQDASDQCISRAFEG